jgi:hypothetical protein
MLRKNQLVIIALDSKVFDRGRAVDVRKGDTEAGIPMEVTIRCDSLGGEEKIFRYFHGEAGWRHVFQNPLADNGVLCFNSRAPVFQLEGWD